MSPRNRAQILGRCWLLPMLGAATLLPAAAPVHYLKLPEPQLLTWPAQE